MGGDALRDADGDLAREQIVRSAYDGEAERIVARERCPEPGRDDQRRAEVVGLDAASCGGRVPDRLEAERCVGLDLGERRRDAGRHLRAVVVDQPDANLEVAAVTEREADDRRQGDRGEDAEDDERSVPDAAPKLVPRDERAPPLNRARPCR